MKNVNKENRNKNIHELLRALALFDSQEQVKRC